MKCGYCGYILDEEASYCINCRNQVREQSNNRYTYNNNIMGSENVNIVNGDGNEIRITHLHYANNEVVYYQQEEPKLLVPLTKAFKTVICCFLVAALLILGGFGINYLTYIQIPGWISLLLWLFFGCSIFLLLILLELRTNKKAKFPLLKGDFVNLQLDEGKNILLSRFIFSNCPICEQGLILVRKVKDNNQTLYIGICTKNGQHLYTFDEETYTGTRIVL